MSFSRSALVLATAVALTIGCGGSGESRPVPEKAYRAELPTAPLALPDGAVIDVELAITPEEQGRGLMFREYLPPDKGPMPWDRSRL